MAKQPPPSHQTTAYGACRALDVLAEPFRLELRMELLCLADGQASRAEDLALGDVVASSQDAQVQQDKHRLFRVRARVGTIAHVGPRFLGASVRPPLGRSRGARGTTFSARI